MASAKSSKQKKSCVSVCSLNDSAIESENLALKLEQYKKDIERAVKDMKAQRVVLCETQNQQCRDSLQKELADLPSQYLRMQYKQYVMTVLVPQLLQCGCTFDGLLTPELVKQQQQQQQQSATASKKTGLATGARKTTRKNARTAAAAAPLTRPAKLSIVNPFKFNTDDLSRLDPKEVQKLRELFDKLACLFGNETSV